MKNYSIRTSLGMAGILLAGLLGLGVSQATADAVRWDLSMEDQPTSLPGEGATAFAKDVADRTGGELIITVHHSGALGMKNKDHLGAVQDGVLPLAQSLAGTFAGDDPLFLLSSLPFLAKNFDEAQQLMELARPAYEESLASYNQKYLYTSPFPASGIWAKKEISTPADLDGLKVRTYDAVSSQVMKALNATPVQISFSDIIPQLSTGGVEAVVTSADGGRSLKFWEFMSYYNNVGYAFPLNITAVNLDAFEGLSKELQSELLEAAKAAEARDWEAVRNWEAKNSAILEENNVTTVNDFSPEVQDALVSAAQPVVAEWTSQVPIGEEILSQFNKAKSVNE